MSVEAAPVSEVEHWLSRAAVLQFASLALQTPSEEVVAEIRDLVASLPDELKADAAAIAALPADDWEPEFFSVLGPAGCAVAESSYERAAQASRGPLLAQVAAYYEAFGYVPGRLKEVPDHVANELGFLSFLALKAAFAIFESKAEDASVTAEAFADFLDRHPGTWVADCVDAMEATGSAQYTAIARWTREALRRVGEPI